MIRATCVLLACLVGTTALAEPAPPSTEVPSAPATALGPHDLARVVELVGSVKDLAPADRSARLATIAAAGQEDGPVTAALRRAIASTGTYDEALAAAIDGAPEPAAPRLVRAELTPAELQSIRTYGRERLAIRDETTHHGGGGTFMPSFGFGYDYVPNPTYTTHAWAVFQGPSRLDVPHYYAAIGEAEKHDQLEASIRHKRTLARGFYVLAGAGAAATVVGFFGANTASSYQAAGNWEKVSLCGLGGVLVGAIGGTFPGSKATKLEHDYQGQVDEKDAQAHLDAENEKLRQSLGLTPEQVLRVEEGGSRRR